MADSDRGWRRIGCAGDTDGPVHSSSNRCHPFRAGGAERTGDRVGCRDLTDGRHVAFVAWSATLAEYATVAPLDDAQARALPGTDGAFRPFWAPTSQALAFPRRWQIETRRSRQSAATVAGGSWAPSVGWKLVEFGSHPIFRAAVALYTVSASGGEKRRSPVSSPNTKSRTRRRSSCRTEGTFCISRWAPHPKRAVPISDRSTRQNALDSSTHRAPWCHTPIPAICSTSVTATSVHPFDPERRRFTGVAQPIASTRTRTAADIRVGVISASANGILTFGGDSAMARLTWFTRDGTNVGMIRAPVPLHNPTISPDGRYVAADASGSNTSIWLVDLERGTPTRVGDGCCRSGDRVALTSCSLREAGGADLVHRSIMGSTVDEGFCCERQR